MSHWGLAQMVAAPALHAGGRGFEPRIPNQAPMAKLEIRDALKPHSCNRLRVRVPLGAQKIPFQINK